MISFLFFCFVLVDRACLAEFGVIDHVPNWFTTTSRRARISSAGPRELEPRARKFNFPKIYLYDVPNVRHATVALKKRREIPYGS